MIDEESYAKAFLMSKACRSRAEQSIFAKGLPIPSPSGLKQSARKNPSLPWGFPS
jgi:hypothetical protein